MSTNDTLHVIEDEPYHGLYRGAVQAGLKEMAEAGHLPDRFDLAEILRRTREGKGLSLDEVAEITRVRRVYLEAFEQAAYDVLPPRAFAIGYVKAYAKALDLDEETLADMFKRDVSEPQARLHAPSGASLEDVKPNYRLYIGAALSLVSAIIIWNVVQRQPSLHARADHVSDGIASQSWTQGVPLIHNGVLVVTKPEAAPQDQDVPAPYATPGLEEGFASIEAAHNSSLHGAGVGDGCDANAQGFQSTRRCLWRSARKLGRHNSDQKERKPGRSWNRRHHLLRAPTWHW